MQIFILIIIGFAGGIIGGMGMGGGTLLIPLLLLFASKDQHSAQAINLAVFIPMSIIALIIHFKNKLVNLKFALWTAVPATIAGVFGSILANKMSSEKLGVYFGIFLLVLGIYQLTDAIIKKVKEK